MRLVVLSILLERIEPEPLQSLTKSPIPFFAAGCDNFSRSVHLLRRRLHRETVVSLLVLSLLFLQFHAPEPPSRVTVSMPAMAFLDELAHDELYIPLENAYEESRRQNILQNKIIAAKLGILWNGTKSPHPKSLPRFFTRVMCRQKDDSVGQLLKKLATAHVPNKDSERASDADIGRKEAGFGPIVLASNHLRGRLGSAHLDPPELNIKEKQVTAHVPAKQHCSTDVQSSSDANVCRNKTEGCGNGEAKIRRLQKDLDVATWRNKEMNRGWNSTIQDGLHVVADLQKLVAGNLVTALADADVHEINWTILEQAMDRSWITDGTKKFTTKYMAGVRDFIKFAREHLDNTDEPILCPCKDCLNLIRQDIKTVEDHCNCSGMSMTYTRWTRHGEDFSDDEGRDRNDDGAYDSDNDEEEDNGDCYVDDSSSMIDELQKSGNKGPDLPNLYANLIESAKKELYEGCTSFTRLSFIIKLLHVKSYSRITNRGFDLLLQLLRTALPDVDFPKSYADAKSVLSDVGLGYETIHACKFDCSLFWGDHKDDTNCHVCGLSRYRDPTGKKKIPHKVLRYFPIIKRLQRLFVKKEMSTHTRWHKEKRVVEPNVLRHPADGEAWKHFDGKFDWFAKDPRNIRLGFATDGFSPFGSMSNPYSMWPVFVIPYNFPPWMCMDQSNYMMALLIPGKYSPGKDFHVFMQPLIKDMMQLWSGVETFDACTEEYFPLHAAFLWKSRLFNGTTETRDPPRKYTPKEVAAKVERVKDFEHGKNPISRKRKRATVPGEPTWHLKVSLHHLPYWPELKIAHNLDVMHIEKNICDNIVGTLLELEGRNKDTVSARIDLKKFKMWKKYWLKKIVKDDDDAAVTYAKPPAPWTLSKEQKRHLCRFFKDGTETRFNKDDRNQDIRRKPDPDEMEVFSVGAKGLGKSILKHFDKEFDKMVWYVLNNCDDVERYINEFRQELGGRGVRDIEETVQREFAGWFANHVRQLDNASEDLKSLAAGPDRRVVVYAGCNVKGARFRTLTRDKDLKTQNSGVATKGSFGDADETDYYGVLQEVLELQYGTNKHGDRSVYLFRCDWFDLASKGSKIKDDGFFKSVNTSILWFKNSPFILASQAETCFYLEDTKFGDPWKVVQKFSHRHVYDVPELEDGNDDAFVRNEDAYQEDEGSVDHTFHDVVDLDEEAEVEAEEDDHRAAEVVRIHDARTIRELENGEDSPNVDMDMSEDELENQEDSVILEENIHDDEGKNSEEDSDLD
ncbi:hypothetical protein QYE76_028461 [Lolium multiflorum]|uniref:Uncharacterized protein n=1 Tax=Lolium multiflorum TaxID=4521 RepID=A0AAD8VH72_LOLMU|nr:hypothetical protein QYE76_028461 [Lolium multiflorum]